MAIRICLIRLWSHTAVGKLYLLYLLLQIISTALNLSHVVARHIWRRRGGCPLRCRAHRLHRRRPLWDPLVPMATIGALLHTARNWALRAGWL